MSNFPICKTIQEALEHVERVEPDSLGHRFYTFRVMLSEADDAGHAVISSLIDHGWQIVGGPLTVEGGGNEGRHVVVSMRHIVPKELEIRGRIDLRGEFRGEGNFEGRGV